MSDVRVDDAASPPAALGLTSAEALRRREAAGPRRRPRTSRSYLEIVWANVFNLFNLILGALLAVILILGDYRDALFGGIIVANSLIGIIQETRAKRTLDRLALLVAPRARVWRDGELTTLGVDEVVAGDVIRMEPGDQVVADGEVVDAQSLSLDESILTGEADHVTREPGERVLSGGYCVAGYGDYRADAVGQDSFAERLAAEAKGVRTAASPLQQDINRILKLTVWVMIPLAAILVTVLAIRRTDFYNAARTTVAALVPIVPEGLVLLASLTFAVAAVRLARLGTLAQQLNAIESLASVDTVCVDKTGTLTDNRLRVVAIEPADGRDEDDLREALGALAASVGTRNPTMQAILDAAPAEAEELKREVPFSSARKWSGATLEGHGTLVLGAPDILTAQGVTVPEALGGRIAEQAGERRRVVLLASSPAPLDGETLPAGLEALGIVALSEGLRADAKDTVDYLTRSDVAVKVISGDGVRTVQAVARATGVPHADRAIAGPDLPEEGPELERVATETTVFGRITPEQKRDLVRAMTAQGRYVAMIGDGVNDVLALKEARLAIAMGNGSQMAKGVADLVLLTNAFSTVPVAIEEGRRILRNTHRVAKLFVSKSMYAVVLLATIGLAPIAFLFLPRHLSITSTLTIGIPAFFLALAKSTGAVRSEGFLRGLLAFCIPAGTIAALTILASYLIVRGPLDKGVIEGRTAAVITATGMGLAILVQVERGPEHRPVRWWVWAMVAAFALAFTLGLQIAPLRSFFAVVRPSSATWWVCAGCLVVGTAVLLAVRRIPRLARMEAETD